MATPMTHAQMLKALKAEGCDLIQVRNWKTHNRNHKGAWGDVHGVLVHHTAGVFSGMPEFVYSGTASLPGPLCHALAAKNGKTYLVGHGRANHAGTVAANAMLSILNESPIHPRPDAKEPVDGNRQLYGIEIENRGDGKDPYPDKQYDQAVRWAAAICRFHGWSANSVAGHAEVTRRKIDPSFPMVVFRAAVAARLKHSASWSPAEDTPAKPPTPPKVTPMRYSQISRQEPLTIPAGETRKVYFTAPDTRDDPNEHGSGGYTILSSPAVYSGTVAVYSGTGVASTISVNMAQELADGTVTTSSLAGVELSVNPGPDWYGVPVAGFLPATRKLFVEIENHGGVAVTVSRVDVRLISFAE